VDIIAGTELLFVEPAANAATLKCIVETPGKVFVGMVIADEARIELNRLVQEGGQIIDELVRKAATPQESEGELAGFGESSMVELSLETLTPVVRGQCEQRRARPFFKAVRKPPR